MDPELRAYLDQRFEVIDRRFEAVDRRFEEARREEEEWHALTRREFNILAENFRGEVQQVADGHRGLVHRIDTLEERLDRKIDTAAAEARGGMALIVRILRDEIAQRGAR